MSVDKTKTYVEFDVSANGLENVNNQLKTTGKKLDEIVDDFETLDKKSSKTAEQMVIGLKQIDKAMQGNIYKARQLQEELQRTAGLNLAKNMKAIIGKLELPDNVKKDFNNLIDTTTLDNVTKLGNEQEKLTENTRKVVTQLKAMKQEFVDIAMKKTGLSLDAGDITDIERFNNAKELLFTAKEIKIENDKELAVKREIEKKEKEILAKQKQKKAEINSEVSALLTQSRIKNKLALADKDAVAKAKVLAQKSGIRGSSDLQKLQIQSVMLDGINAKEKYKSSLLIKNYGEHVKTLHIKQQISQFDSNAVKVAYGKAISEAKINGYKKNGLHIETRTLQILKEQSSEQRKKEAVKAKDIANQKMENKIAIQKMNLEQKISLYSKEQQQQALLSFNSARQKLNATLTENQALELQLAKLKQISAEEKKQADLVKKQAIDRKLMNDRMRSVADSPLGGQLGGLRELSIAKNSEIALTKARDEAKALASQLRKNGDISEKQFNRMSKAVDKSTLTLKKQEKAVRGIMTATGETTSKFRALFVWMTRAFITVQISKGMNEWAVNASKLNMAMGQFKQLGDYKDFSEQLEKISDVTGGLIGKYEMMPIINKGVTLGLDLTKGKMLELVDATTKLAQKFGIDAKKSAEDFIVGVSKASPIIMDNIGILLKREQAYMRYFNRLEGETRSYNDWLKTVNQEQKNQIYADEGIREMKKLARGFVVIEDTYMSSVKKLKDTWTDFSTTMKSDYGIVSAMEKVVFIINEAVKGLSILAKIADRFMTMGKVGIFDPSMQFSGASEKEAENIFNTYVKDQAKRTRAAESIGEAIESATNEHNRLIRKLSDIGGEIGLSKKQVDKLNKMLSDGAKGQARLFDTVNKSRFDAGIDVIKASFGDYKSAFEDAEELLQYQNRVNREGTDKSFKETLERRKQITELIEGIRQYSGMLAFMDKQILNGADSMDIFSKSVDNFLKSSAGFERRSFRNSIAEGLDRTIKNYAANTKATMSEYKKINREASEYALLEMQRQKAMSDSEDARAIQQSTNAKKHHKELMGNLADLSKEEKKQYAETFDVLYSTVKPKDEALKSLGGGYKNNIKEMNSYFKELGVNVTDVFGEGEHILASYYIIVKKIQTQMGYTNEEMGSIVRQTNKLNDASIKSASGLQTLWTVISSTFKHQNKVISNWKSMYDQWRQLAQDTFTELMPNEATKEYYNLHLNMEKAIKSAKEIYKELRKNGEAPPTGELELMINGIEQLYDKKINEIIKKSRENPFITEYAKNQLSRDIENIESDLNKLKDSYDKTFDREVYMSTGISQDYDDSIRSLELFRQKRLNMISEIEKKEKAKNEAVFKQEMIDLEQKRESDLKELEKSKLLAQQISKDLQKESNLFWNVMKRSAEFLGLEVFDQHRIVGSYDARTDAVKKEYDERIKILKKKKEELTVTKQQREELNKQISSLKKQAGIRVFDIGFDKQAAKFKESAKAEIRNLTGAKELWEDTMSAGAGEKEGIAFAKNFITAQTRELGKQQLFGQDLTKALEFDPTGGIDKEKTKKKLKEMFPTMPLDEFQKLEELIDKISSKGVELGKNVTDGLKTMSKEFYATIKEMGKALALDVGRAWGDLFWKATVTDEIALADMRNQKDENIRAINEQFRAGQISQQEATEQTADLERKFHEDKVRMEKEGLRQMLASLGQQIFSKGLGYLLEAPIAGWGNPAKGSAYAVGGTAMMGLGLSLGALAKSINVPPSTVAKSAKSEEKKDQVFYINRNMYEDKLEYQRALERVIPQTVGGF